MASEHQIRLFLSNYPDEVQAIVWAARQLLESTLPRIEETLDESARLIGYGFGPGYGGVICTLILSQTGVKLGFVRGSELADPKRMLAGAGKLHRYVQLRTADDLTQPGLKRLLTTALAAWRRRDASGDP